MKHTAAAWSDMTKNEEEGEVAAQVHRSSYEFRLGRGSCNKEGILAFTISVRPQGPRPRASLGHGKISGRNGNHGAEVHVTDPGSCSRIGI